MMIDSAIAGQSKNLSHSNWLLQHSLQCIATAKRLFYISGLVAWGSPLTPLKAAKHQDL